MSEAAKDVVDLKGNIGLSPEVTNEGFTVGVKADIAADISDNEWEKVGLKGVLTFETDTTFTPPSEIKPAEDETTETSEELATPITIEPQMGYAFNLGDWQMGGLRLRIDGYDITTGYDRFVDASRDASLLFVLSNLGKNNATWGSEFSLQNFIKNDPNFYYKLKLGYKRSTPSVIGNYDENSDAEREELGLTAPQGTFVTQASLAGLPIHLPENLICIGGKNFLNPEFIYAFARNLFDEAEKQSIGWNVSIVSAEDASKALRGLSSASLTFGQVYTSGVVLTDPHNPNDPEAGPLDLMWDHNNDATDSVENKVQLGLGWDNIKFNFGEGIMASSKSLIGYKWSTSSTTTSAVFSDDDSTIDLGPSGSDSNRSLIYSVELNVEF